jgi:hypothetical protein
MLIPTPIPMTVTTTETIDVMIEPMMARPAGVSELARALDRHRHSP